MPDYLQVHAERRNGLAVLRVSGDLDAAMAGTFADHAQATVRAIPGAVLVDLSGLAFIDAHGARALAAVIQALAASRPTVVRYCPPKVRRSLELLGLPPDYIPAGDRASSESETFQLVDRVWRARLHAGEAKLGARWALARLSDTCIRVASTRERAGLVVEQGRQAVATSKAVREQVRRSRQGA